MMTEGKILVIFCGGTIASCEENGVRSLDKTSTSAVTTPESFALIRHYMQHTQNSPKFEVKTLAPLFLSENATICVWNRLIKLLKTVDFSGKSFCGVIITHGTDTLAYVATLLSIVLRHTKIPVMLVSANASLEDENTNGHKNFSDAVEFICAQAGVGRGVFVPYSYNLQTTTIYKGEHITQAQPFLHRFESFNGQDYGRIASGEFIPGEGFFAEEKNAGDDSNKNLLIAMPPLKNDVLLLMPYVGLDYSKINFDADSIRVVLHGTYHSGTVCIDISEEEKTSSVKWFFAQCAQRGIPIHFVGIQSGGAVYTSLAEVKSMCVKGKNGKVYKPHFLYDVSVEYAYAKLLIG